MAKLSDYAHEISKPKFIGLSEATELLKILNNATTYPILLDERKGKSDFNIKQIDELKGLIVGIIEQWQKLFLNKPSKKHFQEITGGRMTIEELQILYITERKLDKKYPEFDFEKLIGVVSFPDFAGILKLIGEIIHFWFQNEITFGCTFKLVDVFNNGDPIVKKEWGEKIRLKNAIKVYHKSDRDKLMVNINFGVACLHLLAHGSLDIHQKQRFFRFVGSDNFIPQNNACFDMTALQDHTRLGAFSLSNDRPDGSQILKIVG